MSDEVEYLCGCKASGDLVSMSCPIHRCREIHPLILMLEGFLKDNGFDTARNPERQLIYIYYNGIYCAKLYIPYVKEWSGQISEVFIDFDDNIDKSVVEFDICCPDSFNNIKSRLLDKAAKRLAVKHQVFKGKT